MSDVKTIMLVGVGGQGTLLASRLLGYVLEKQGYDIKISEVHGMSQRGGSVVTYIKYGEKVFSPIIDKGTADYIVSFELCETARWLPFLKKGGKIISNTQQIDPMPVITGAMKYPENIAEKIKNMNIDITALNALDLAAKSGSSKAVNVVLLGVLAKFIGIDKKMFIEALEHLVKPQFLEINKQAFELGFN